MTKSKFNRTIKSAYNDAKQFFNYYKANGYRVIYKDNDGIKKPYKTSNIIEMLNITEAEQYEMNTLRDPSIKCRKDIKKLERERRTKAMRTMQEYNDEQNQQKLTRIELLKQLLKDNPEATRKELASKLGVSKARITQLRKKIFEGVNDLSYKHIYVPVFYLVNYIFNMQGGDYYMFNSQIFQAGIKSGLINQMIVQVVIKKSSTTGSKQRLFFLVHIMIMRLHI